MITVAELHDLLNGVDGKPIEIAIERDIVLLTTVAAEAIAVVGVLDEADQALVVKAKKL